MKNVMKFVASSISAFTGLILVSIIAMDFTFTTTPLLIVYFLPGFCIGLILLFELLTRIQSLKGIYSFIQGSKIVLLFFVLLCTAWIIIWKVDPVNDVVFTSQFAVAVISSIILYNWLGKKWNLFSTEA